MEAYLSPWVTEAARLPLAFAQVREDAALDVCVAEQLGEDVRVIMVGSGGCTAAALAACPSVARLHIVDPNPAQIALCGLKLRLLQAFQSDERLALLGHIPMPPAARQARLTSELQLLGISPEALGPPELIGEMGPDYLGRYECVFAALRRELHDHQKDLASLLELYDPAEQARRVDATTALGRALEEAFERVMALPNLVKLFGEGATGNRREPFSRHFASRTRHVLATMSAAETPYLSQMLLGRFTNMVVYPWLAAKAPSQMPNITWATTTMNEALRAYQEKFDFVHLSNILDWLCPEEARWTLELAWAALRDGGQVVVRQLNSRLDIPGLESRFDWQEDLSRKLLQTDRSFFYRAIYVGRKEEG